MDIFSGISGPLMSHINLLSRASVIAAAAVLSMGCAAGPDYAPPDAPDVAAYDYEALNSATADGTQELLLGQDIPAEWWELFRSKDLSKLIAQAIRGNPDLATAEAALRVAQDNLSSGEAAFFPAASGTFSSQRSRTSKDYGAGARSIYTLHSASVGVSYDLDLWGGTRRNVERLEAEADAAQYEREAAYLALTSNVVTLAMAEAGLREQIASAEAVLDAQKQIVELVKLRLATGAVPKGAVVAQDEALASAEGALPPLQHQLAVIRHALSALVGQMPVQQVEGEFRLSGFNLPQKVPMSVPSKLVEQRPDVRAAEASLRAASAAIGVAQAARLPKISLSADIGTMAKIFKNLLTPGFGFWDFGASAAQSLFDAGSLANKEQAARDAYDMAAAQYKKTAIGAFQEVADALHALQSDAKSYKSSRDAENAAQESVKLTQTQFSAGAVGKAELLTAQQGLYRAKAASAKALAQRYADTAALLAALGGGWWNDKAAAAEAAPVVPESGAGEEAAPLSTSNLSRKVSND